MGKKAFDLVVLSDRFDGDDELFFKKKARRLVSLGTALVTSASVWREERKEERKKEREKNLQVRDQRRKRQREEYPLAKGKEWRRL